jgi:hypothetical protein
MLIPAIIAHQPLASLGMLPIFLGIDAATCASVYGSVCLLYWYKGANTDTAHPHLGIDAAKCRFVAP